MPGCGGKRRIGRQACPNICPICPNCPNRRRTERRHREQIWISRAQVFASCVRLEIIFMDACSIPRLLYIHNIHVRY